MMQQLQALQLQQQRRESRLQMLTLSHSACLIATLGRQQANCSSRRGWRRLHQPIRKGPINALSSSSSHSRRSSRSRV